MFTGLSPLVLVGFSFLPVGPDRDVRYYPYSTFYSMSSHSALYATGKVLDVFDNNQVLISLGANHGVRKGMEMDVYRLQPEPGYAGRVELIEVGAKHAIGRFRDKVGTPKKVRENDLAYLVYKMPPLPTPAWLQPGGAILDPGGIL